MSRLRTGDVARLAARGLRGHPVRFLLSALGIAIGVAAMVAVTGIAQSSQADLDQKLDRLGTNLLTVLPAEDLNGEQTRLPPTAAAMLRRIAPVTAASAVGQLDDLGAYRSPYVPEGQTSSVVVAAVDTTLLATVRGEVSRGHWFTPAGSRYPTVVLGAAAARRLGIETPGTRVWVGDQWAVVVGVLAPLDLAPELDPAVMLPAGSAQQYFGSDGTATSVYVRTDEDRVAAVSDVVPATAAPESPELVSVSRPSSALEAKLAADDALDQLLLGLAAVGLLVGGIGVSNTMIIASIERRSEIGLRRALGATRPHIAIQFLAESLLMSVAGGVGGVVLGSLVTAYWSRAQGVPPALPVWVGALGIGLTAVVGSLAGLYPAVRASRESPVSALASL
ncbi:ABC transporter permease [Nocardioides marmoriginsengisoli]|uniref:ABC transporter permease n=1 Tax=Nocardioides marmoriginsengisoli TaxID=661483 RepID=A0A3N0CPI2_9ACTN|nr:ABC transporter permease [Nocardioides marmoriginsengisoli]RNL64946.1 ABC transporter permease [Nocardioides marmoriginsengisoli]